MHDWKSVGGDRLPFDLARLIKALNDDYQNRNRRGCANKCRSINLSPNWLNLLVVDGWSGNRRLPVEQKFLEMQRFDG
ncbi:hypothetical protein CEXT_387921 [Caerostris extrusa]|uniref:Uncharacterized protein n=1 Tax=Caerostris extrusa TaxID=172846 RepID=A0AAV4UDQ4_CAEEX|nr:hypothetical protein CEXT_387921 [Caerostris extrusa]